MNNDKNINKKLLQFEDSKLYDYLDEASTDYFTTIKEFTIDIDNGNYTYSIDLANIELIGNTIEYYKVRAIVRYPYDDFNDLDGIKINEDDFEQTTGYKLNKLIEKNTHRIIRGY